MLTIEPLRHRYAFKVKRDGRFYALLIENEGHGWYFTRLGESEQGPYPTKDDALRALEGE